MYFNKIPTILYPYTLNGEEVLKIVKDITFNVRFRKEILENITLYDEYDVREGETPEIVSNLVYGTPEYHWVIMLINQRYDYIRDWPLPYHTFEQYVLEKYGDDVRSVHHYELDGFVVDSNVVGAESVTNYDYEERINNDKRKIKIVSANLLATIINNYRNIV